MALPSKNRLKETREISKLFSSTHPITTEHFSLRVLNDHKGVSFKISILVPAKVAALATARNRLRRQTSEALSRIIEDHSIISGVKAVIILKHAAIPDGEELSRELLSLMKKSGILNT